MRTVIPRSARLSVGVVLVAVGLVGAVRAVDPAGNALSGGVPSGFDKVIEDNANRMVREGRQTFRFDTFGDEAFWGDALQLHKAIAGEKHGGVGGGVSPKTALSVGLKVDVGALPPALQEQLKAGKVDLDDPATTLALLKLNAVVGVTGFFDARGSIRSIGLQCAFCHSTVDDALAPGIGRRPDGWAHPSCGQQYPVRARSGSANTRGVPDRLPAKLAALHFYQLSIPAPKALVGSFSAAAASRGKALFDGRARCASCHVPPLFTEPGNNLHAPAEIGVDAFQADRSPTHMYRTAPLAGLWTHQKGGFYHDGRFATLLDVVAHYDTFFKLSLRDQEKKDLVEYLKGL